MSSKTLSFRKKIAESGLTTFNKKNPHMVAFTRGRSATTALAPFIIFRSHMEVLFWTSSVMGKWKKCKISVKLKKIFKKGLTFQKFGAVRPLSRRFYTHFRILSSVFYKKKKIFSIFLLFSCVFALNLL